MWRWVLAFIDNKPIFTDMTNYLLSNCDDTNIKNGLIMTTLINTEQIGGNRYEYQIEINP